MQYLIDTADPNEIEEVMAYGIDGITANTTMYRRQGIGVRSFVDRWAERKPSFLSGEVIGSFEQMEEQAKELETKEFTAKAGGGAVEVTVTGKKEVTKVKLSEEVVDPEDIEMLEDLIVAATNEALRMADEASAEVMNKMAGGLGGGFPF